MTQTNETMENLTIVNTTTQLHYDTNDEIFYQENWTRTNDSKEYLEMLIKHSPEKFEGCKIEENLTTH